VVEVGVFDQGELFLSALVRHKKDGFKWEVGVVYGLAQHENIEDFLEELSAKCQKTMAPIVWG
jgi:hypothetical protein